MIKIIGAACVLLGSCAWGILGVIKLRRRAAALGVITRSLGALRAELCTRLSPLPEIVRHIADESEEPFKAFCRALAVNLPELGETRFYELWARAVRDTGELTLLGDEAAVLTDAGRSLGRYDIEEQRAALLYAEARFAEFTERAERRRDADSKTRAAFGVAAGVFAVLILL